jgi:hypothetical protein
MIPTPLHRGGRNQTMQQQRCYECNGSGISDQAPDLDPIPRYDFCHCPKGTALENEHNGDLESALDVLNQRACDWSDCSTILEDMKFDHELRRMGVVA